jgi:D-alanine-D-alanine ligase
MSKKTVAIFFGGRSPEHEISLLSAKNVTAALDKSKFNALLIGISKGGGFYKFEDSSIFDLAKELNDTNSAQNGKSVALVIDNGKPTILDLQNGNRTIVDIAFPVLHGTHGEDGCIQGLFKLVDLPFVGCGVWSSAAGMDKEVMKRLLKDANIRSANYMLITPWSQPSYKELTQKLGSPFFIKPASMGSSVGVHKIKDEDSFNSKLKDAFQYDNKILAEEFIDGREIECSVMGPNHQPSASVAGEVTPTHEFYSYEAKYLDEKGASLQIPANISEDQLSSLQALARKTYSTLGCEGLTRVDFFLRKSDGLFYVNEVNTLPGFTKISMYPKMWEASGLAYTPLITKLLELGFDRHKNETNIQRSFLRP